ncbi:hypothetical protein K458DRAFT_437823 [Lentithecium fluviatile CBS 122367]|uniref:MARVEL domain-containing protein n=1 Tax=Lentithecium fluviatile CBS 122367 TaxID=1168545 RepID=A0A6G1ICP2_9PLEO|nr:hypothetical protein K458DRAFT_437823 [Lentithecium fluviatile CBS 122367]
MAESQQRPLGLQMLRGVGIFQAIVALPTMFILGMMAYIQLFESYLLYYYFVADSLTAIMAAGIIFIVYVQRKAIVSSFQTLVFEAIKSALATGLWLWLILDSAFGPWKNWRHIGDEDVERRIKRAALSSILLVLLFYPPLGYAYISWRAGDGDDDQDAERSERTERTPLLSQGCDSSA